MTLSVYINLSVFVGEGVTKLVTSVAALRAEVGSIPTFIPRLIECSGLQGIRNIRIRDL